MARPEQITKAIADFSGRPVTDGLSPEQSSFLQGAGIFDFPEIDGRGVTNLEFLRKMESMLPGIIKALHSSPEDFTASGHNLHLPLHGRIKELVKWLDATASAHKLPSNVHFTRPNKRDEPLHELADFLHIAGLKARDEHVRAAMELRIMEMSQAELPATARMTRAGTENAKEMTRLAERKEYAEELAIKLSVYGAICNKIRKDYQQSVPAARAATIHK